MTANAATIAREAERRLEREYEPLKAETLRSLSAKLRGHGIRAPEEDLEEYYNQAWHALYMQAASGTEIANTGGFLVQVGFRRAIDDFRRSRPDERADVPLEDVAPTVESDVVERLEDKRRLREFSEALREELGERERVAASLCYIHGYTRPEAAQLMGLNERRMQKVMDAVSKAIGRITREIETGERCEQRASLNKAYALGLLDPDGERYAAARSHLDECSRCRGYVLGLRGLASVAPPTLLPWAAIHGGGGAGGAATAKPRARPRVNPATAAVVTAAVAVATVAGVMIARGSSDDGRPIAETPTASAPPAGAPGSSAPSESSSRSSESSSRSSESSSRSSESSRSGDSSSRSNDSASRPSDDSSGPPNSSPGSGGSAPGSSDPAPADSSPAPPAATPVSPVVTPPPAATAPPPAPEPTAAPEPTVIDDGSQEFGVEP